MSAIKFNAVLLEISNELDAENLNKLKFLVRDMIKKKEAENVETGHKLFELLAERGQLAADDTDYLSRLLKEIHRDDLADKLNRFQSREEPMLDEKERAKLDAASEVVAENLGRYWRKLGRKLGLTEPKLDTVSKRHPTDLEETAVELLKEWRKSRAAEARAEELIQALRLCQFNLTADKVEEKLKVFRD